MFILADKDLEVKEIKKGTGEILSDVRINKKTGEWKEQPWKPYKSMNTVLDGIYDTALVIDPTCISPSAKFSLHGCASYLLFKRDKKKGAKKLDTADFCKHRLCPICNWRKSLKMFAQMQIVSKALMEKFPTARFLFLTLTVRNCSGDELKDTLDAMNAGLKLMFNPGKTNKSGKPVKAMLLGYAKATEVNYNPEEFITEEMFKKNKAYYKKSGLAVGDPNPSFDTYHPHFHILVMVKGEYFRGINYLSQAKWTDIWQNCMKLDYKPMVNIQVVKPNEKDLTSGATGLDMMDGTAKEKAMTAAISETFKYPMKPNSLKLDMFHDLDLNEQERIVQAVIIYSHALRRRRLVTFGGEILKMRKILKQDDVEDGDLIDVGDEPTIESEFDFILFKYFKQMGCYVC